jgi:hypothetical protein
MLSSRQSSTPFALLVAFGIATSACRRSTPQPPDAWAYARRDAGLDASARNARDEEDAARSAALAVAWHDMQPGQDRCPLGAIHENDLVVVIDGRATTSPRRQTPIETVVVLDARSPDRAIARLFLYDRAMHRMVCGATIEVSGRERLIDALRRAQPTVLVERGWSDAATAD